MSDEEEKDDPALSALLKRSFAPSDGGPAEQDEQKILHGVQRKLRKRSKGKFYGDGWSTSRLNYALIAAVMLLTIVVVYLALGPTGISLR